MSYRLILWISVIAIGLSAGVFTPESLGQSDATFTISLIEPSAKERMVKIHFTAPVDAWDFSRSIRMVPPLSMYPVTWYQDREVPADWLYLSGDFKYGQTYVITVADRARAQNGRLYKKTLNRFTMPDLEPSIRFIDKQTVIERDSRQMVHADLVNVEQILFEGIGIPPVLIPSASAVAARSARETMAWFEQYCRDRAKAVQNALGGNKDFAPFLGPAEPCSNLFFSQIPRNESRRFSMPLSFRQNPGKGALEFIRLRDNSAKVADATNFRLFRITDLGISYKWSSKNLVVWVTSLRTGKPQANIAILLFDRDQNAFPVGVTSRDGILVLGEDITVPVCNFSSDEKQFVVGQRTLKFSNLRYLVAATDEDCSYADLLPKGHLRQRNFENIKGVHTRATVYTERGAYRPGETVHYKATVRAYREEDIRLPKDATCAVTLMNSRDEVVYKKNLAYSEYGSVYDDIPLKTYAKLGTYTLSVRSASPGESIGQCSFEVQEFQPPRHKVDIKFRRDSREVDDYVNLERHEEYVVCTISGQYYVGGPVKNGKVRWKVYTSPTDYALKQYPEYTFRYPSEEDGVFLETAESILSETGVVDVRIPLGAEALSGMHGIKVIATVVDFDGRPATSTGVYQEPVEYRVGVGPHPDDVNGGVAQALSFIVVNPDGKKLRSGEVEVSVLERYYWYDRKRSENGNTYWKRDQGWREQYSTRLKLADSQALFEFDFQRGGQFLVRCTYRDKKGRAYSAGTTYSVDWGQYWYNQDRWQPAFETIQIVPDKKEYAVGETMRLLVRSEKQPAACMLTLERDRVIDHQLVRLTGDEIRIPVTADLRPNVYISILGTLGREDFPTYQGEYDTGTPTFVFGAVNVKVRNTVEELNVAINGDEKEIKALPGSEKTLSIHVTDSKRQGVVAEMAVAVVDERVLALTRYSTPHLKNLLEFLLPLLVATGETRTEIQAQTPFFEFRDEPLTGGDGEFETAGKPIDTQIRKDFNPVAYFNPALMTDENGQASATFKFPDTLTQYRVFVIACDKGSRFASKEREAVVAKDFYLEPGLPRFLTKGDTFRFNVAAFNKTEAEGPVLYHMETSPGLKLMTPAQSYLIKPMDSRMIPVEGTAETAEAARILFKGDLNSLSDAVQIDIPVNSGYLIDHDYLLGEFTGRKSVNYAFPPGTREIPWGELESGDVQCELTLSGSPLLRMEPGLKYLLHYPYGCIEQTSSGVLPLAALRSLIKAGYVPRITIEETDKFLKGGIERIFSMQTADGGFAYWPGQRETSNWGTMYGVTALTYARQAGFDVPADRFDRALNFLSNQMLADQGSDPLHNWGFNYRGMIAYLLSKTGKLDAGQFRRVEERYHDMNREGKLLTLLAAHQIQFLPQEELAVRLRQVLGELPRHEDRIPFHAIKREPAIALMACTAILPSGTEASDQALRLMGDANRRGCWTSTSDTSWVLLALSEYYRNTFFNREPIRGRVVQNGEEPQPFVFDASRSVVLTLNPKRFLVEPNVTIEVEGQGAVIYNLALTFPRLDYAKTGFTNGFKIYKYVENVEGGETIRVGDIVKVRVVLDAESYGYEQIVIDDPLPAGLVAINSAFATEPPVKETNQARDEDYWWYYWDEDGFYKFVPNYFELRDDRVVAFRDNLWHGQYQYSYFARAVCAGTFRVPPSKVQLMYRPEIIAYTPESSVVIEER